MLISVFQVAVGGSMGAVARYLASLAVLRALGPGFPWGVVVVNIVGSFLMGVFVIWAAQKSMTHLSPFIMTGLLGGFTTFSAFSLDTVTLIERGQFGSASLYVVLSVSGAVGALFVGILAARGIWG
ncbi:fluoride efflux transporter CrcB [Oceaniglobus ichthyenteri]|uniref:fluoride efflux transporter CrcB n=1 Tax=Oceaniglobus ichthyenteri TaxID=2136177 RepID=UPI000D33F740|nr:fluoride efflux transporter CrcB [Oceaniglobus ichthyenteri]